jgi:hypothetical protein
MTRLLEFLKSIFCGNERGSFSFKPNRLAGLQNEVKRLQDMVNKRNTERETLAKEKDLTAQIDKLRKDLGIFPIDIETGLPTQGN